MHESPFASAARHLDPQLAKARTSNEYQYLRRDLIRVASQAEEPLGVLQWLVHREELIPDREVAALFDAFRSAEGTSAISASIERAAQGRGKRLAATQERLAYLRQVASLPASDLAAMFESSAEVAKFTEVALESCEPRRSSACQEVVRVEAALSELVASSRLTLDQGWWVRIWRASHWVKE